MRLGPGDRVLATRTTYVSSALQLLELERVGVTVEIVPDAADESGPDLEALESMLRRARPRSSPRPTCRPPPGGSSRSPRSAR